MFRGGGTVQNEPAPNAETNEPSGESELLRDVFGAEISRACHGFEPKQRMHGADLIIERLKGSALLASGHVMFAPALGLAPVEKELVSMACFDLMQGFVLDETPSVCDKVPPLLREVLGLLRPQAASISELKQATAELIALALEGGPRGALKHTS